MSIARRSDQSRLSGVSLVPFACTPCFDINSAHCGISPYLRDRSNQMKGSRSQTKGAGQWMDRAKTYVLKFERRETRKCVVIQFDTHHSMWTRAMDISPLHAILFGYDHRVCCRMSSRTF
jgi:hypothetical protein